MDISTLAWSKGRVRAAATDQFDVPDGVLVGRHAEPVNDPAWLYGSQAVDEVALAPLGTGPAKTECKGYVPAVMVELVGGAVGRGMVCRKSIFESPGGDSALFLATTPDILGRVIAGLAEHIKALEKHVRRTQPLDPDCSVRLHGRSTAVNKLVVNIPHGLAALLVKLAEGRRT